MELFHVVVLSVALVVLILLLTFIGILMSRNKSGEAVTFPPTYNTCPDYWSISQDGSGCVIPSYESSLNIGNIYSTGGQLNSAAQGTFGFKSVKDPKNKVINMIDFNNSNWKGQCSIKKWTADNNIVWDGISNYNSCP